LRSLRWLYNINVVRGVQTTIEREQQLQMGWQLLKVIQEILGENHPDTIDFCSILAIALQMHGDLEQAERKQRDALEAIQRVLGPEHPKTLNYIALLAHILQEQNRLQEAEEMFRGAIPLMEKVVGHDHHGAIACLHNLAFLLDKRGKHDEALETYMLVLDLDEKALGLDHPKTFITMRNMIHCSHRIENLEIGKELREELRRRVLEGPKFIVTKDDRFRKEVMSLLGI